MSEFTLPLRSFWTAGRTPSAAVYLLGQVALERVLALQERLVFEAGADPSGQITLLLCEHPPIITIGRAGARSDIQLDHPLLAGRQLEMYRVNRGGGAMLHHPGQLAIYPIVPLERLGWTVGEYLERFQGGLAATLEELKIACHRREGQAGLWGASGQLVSLGVAVKDWTTYYGAQLHVGPALPLQQYIAHEGCDATPLGSLSTEGREAMKMTTVRTRVVRQLVEAFGCEKHHVFTDHPLLPYVLKDRRVKLRAS